MNKKGDLEKIYKLNKLKSEKLEEELRNIRNMISKLEKNKSRIFRECVKAEEIMMESLKDIYRD